LAGHTSLAGGLQQKKIVEILVKTMRRWF